MTQKQIGEAVLGVAVVVAVFFFIYQQYVGKDIQGSAMTSQKSISTDNKERVMTAPVPDTIDGVTADITSESALDLGVIDEEESESLLEVDEDSESVNTLGTSYDENNL